MKMRFGSTFVVLCTLLSLSTAEQCGWQAGGVLCPGGSCCSKYGWCGTTNDYCGEGCQSQCSGGDGGGGGGVVVTSVASSQETPSVKCLSIVTIMIVWQEGSIHTKLSLLQLRLTLNLVTQVTLPPEKGRLLLSLAKLPMKQLVAGRVHKMVHTHGDTAIIRNKTQVTTVLQVPNIHPCAPGKQYYGRGPIQISWKYNYGQCGRAIGVDLLNNPDLVTSNAEISFKTALWFWMTAQWPKPSSHDVITGQWNPSDGDRATGRLPGCGTTTNIINGDLECGKGYDGRSRSNWIL
ncbi:hypothetical protein L6164_037710 [Bauhinia variegata]|uniref:Uncharacterized protein n=1 Tax=Bauhinia variegata TaxID=167791 RepID=A0ACB9KL23_BAUVA|nr:hypothetical protein L6164_037710 [Bauhinia variegata]